MNNWSTLISDIHDVVYQNNEEAITGQYLQEILDNIVLSLGRYGGFKGVAIPATNPGIVDGTAFYLASEKGIYANFSINITTTGIYILEIQNGVWYLKTLVDNIVISTGENSDFDLVHFNELSTSELNNIGDLKFEDDNKTLQLKISNDTNLKIGRETYILAKNNSGLTIPKGKIVYITGTDAGIPLFNLASSTTTSIISRQIGFTSESSDNQEICNILINGTIDSINTAHMTAGSTVYLSSSGNFTTTTPTGGAIKVIIGICLISNLTTGKIYVNTKIIPRLVDIPSINFPYSPQEGEILIFDSTLQQWKNSSPIELSLSGYLYLGQATTATSPDVTDVPDNQKLYYTFDAPVGTSTFTEFFGYDDEALVLVNTHYPKRYLLMWSGIGYWITVAETVMLGSDVDVYNVTKHNPPISGYHSFPDVLIYIPEGEIRKEGLIISFSTAANTWANYQCKSVSSFTSTEGWVKLPTQIEVNAKIPIADIVDNLSSTLATVPLSAKQGKVLGDRTLDQLPNVNTTGKHGGDLLQWDSTSSKWVDISPRKLSMDGAVFLGFCTPSITPPTFSGDEYEFVYYIYDAPVGSSSLTNIQSGMTFTETKKKRYYIIYRGTGWDKIADDNFTYLSEFAFFNVTTGIPLGSGYYNLANAIKAVYNLDATLAHDGLVITFEVSDGVWVSYQFTGTGFTGTSGWTQVPTRAEVNLNTDAITALRILGSVYKGVIASEAAASPTLGTSDRVHYTYDCPVSGASFVNFGQLDLPASDTIKRYIISWDGSSWIGTVDPVLLISNLTTNLFSINSDGELILTY